MSRLGEYYEKMQEENSKKRRKKYTQQGTNLASEVTISYDPKIVEYYKDEIRGRNEEQKRLDEEYLKQLEKTKIGGSQLSNMGLDASMGKDQRQFQLHNLIIKKEVVTLQSAMLAMSLGKSTVITYIKELGYQMWDADTNKFVGSKDGKRVGLDTEEEST